MSVKSGVSKAAKNADNPVLEETMRLQRLAEMKLEVK